MRKIPLVCCCVLLELGCSFTPATRMVRSSRSGQLREVVVIDEARCPPKTAISSDQTYDSLVQAASPSAASVNALNEVETWFVEHIEQWYRSALNIKCPFMRRRASDVLDAADMCMRFLIIRHKSLDIVGPPPGWRCQGQTCLKHKRLPVEQVAETIQRDWLVDTDKGYYITGKLNTTIYRDDCLFEGPDPDMPVRGLRKYLNAASQLFDQRTSRSELLSLDIDENGLIVARWRMNGVLRLPWRPALPNWTGRTIYHRDAEGLIYRHEESWDMSVAQAFMRTFWPEMASRIWNDQEEEARKEGAESLVTRTAAPVNRA